MSFPMAEGLDQPNFKGPFHLKPLYDFLKIVFFSQVTLLGNKGRCIPISMNRLLKINTMQSKIVSIIYFISFRD